MFLLVFLLPPLSLPVLIMHRNRNMERWKPLKCEDVESMWGRQQRHAPLRFCFTSIPVRSWSELASCCNAPRSAIDFISIGIARSRRNETEREKESRFNDKRDWLFASLPCINLMEPLATTPLFFLFFFEGGGGRWIDAINHRMLFNETRHSVAISTCKTALMALRSPALICDSPSMDCTFPSPPPPHLLFLLISLHFLLAIDWLMQSTLKRFRNGQRDRWAPGAVAAPGGHRKSPRRRWRWRLRQRQRQGRRCFTPDSFQPLESSV